MVGLLNQCLGYKYMSVTVGQLEKFTGKTAPVPVQNIVSELSPSIVLPVEVQETMDRSRWDSHRVDQVRKDLHKTIGVGDVTPPTEIEQSNALDFWWQKSGQFLPRYVLDELGIVGGKSAPTIQEAMELKNKDQVTAVKDFFGVEREKGTDPLADMLIQETPADPSDVSTDVVKPERKELIKAASVEDLEIIRDTMSSNILDPDFDEKTIRAVDEEIEIKNEIDNVIRIMESHPVSILVGTDFFNSLGFGLPEFTSKKGLNPVENILGLEKGSEARFIKAAARVREMLFAEDPSILTAIGLESGNIAATLIQFALLPDVSKAEVFFKLPKAAKAAIGVGTKAGLIELLQAPKEDETILQRAETVVKAAGVVGLTAAVLSQAITFVKDLPIAKQAAAANKKFPHIAESDWFDILKTAKEGRLEELIIRKPIGVRRQIPKGFRPGFAEIEKPGKVLIKGAKKIARLTARGKEAAAIKAARAVLAIKVQPSKAVKPVKVITKADAAALKELGVLGEGEELRIIADPANKRTIQGLENEVAELKTRRNTLKAEKQFVKANEIAKQVAKKEIALADLKVRSEIKLETTIEGFKEKITRINTATEFKTELRNEAISMVTAIESGLRKDFIIRANKVKTIKNLQKLTEAVEKGVQKFEKKSAIKELDKVIGQVEEKIDELPSPQREKLIAVIDSVSTKKISKQKLDPMGVPRDPDDLDVRARRSRKQLLGDDLQSLQKTTQRLASELSGQLESLEPEVEEALRLPNERIRQLNLIKSKNANELDVDDIKYIVESVKNTFHEAKLKGKLLTKRGFKPLEGTLESAPDEIRSTKKAVKQTKAIAKGKEIDVKKTNIEKAIEGASKIVRLDELHADTIIEVMTDATAPSITKILDTLPHKGLRDTAELFNAWRKVAKQEFSKIGFTDLDQILTEHSVTLAGVKTKLTLSELMSLEMDTRSADNLLQRLDTEGIQIGDKEFKYPVNQAGEDLVDRKKEILDAVSTVRADKRAMAILDVAQKMNIAQQNAINETSQLRFGHDTARDPDYYPRSRVGDERVSGAKGTISIPPESVGRYQQRTGGTKSIRLRPWHEVFLSGLESDASFNGMTLPLRNARILLTDKAFVASMKTAGRQAELKNLITIFSNTQAVSTSKDIADVYGGKILKARTTSALGFRVSTRGTQVMSFYAAQALTGNQGSVIIKLYGKDAISLIEEDSALMSLRWISRRVGVEVGTNASDDAFDLLLFDKTKKLTNKGMEGLVKGDKQAIANIYYQLVEPELLSAKRNGKNINPFNWEGRNVADLPKFSKGAMGSEAFRYAAARRLEYVVRRSQPMFDMLDRSVSMSSPSFARRSFLMFRTALNAMGNVVDSSLVQFQKGQIGKARLTQKLGSVGASMVAVALWKRGLKWAIATGSSAILAGMGVFQFKDKKEKKEIAANILEDTAKGIASLNPITKVMATGVELAADKIAGNDYPWGREPVENPIIDVINSGASAGINVTQTVANVGLLDEFVEEKTKADIEHNQKLADKIADDLVDAIKASWEFGTTITGVPLQAPVQEFIAPLFKQSKIAIIREVTFGDVENPQKFSEGINDLFNMKADLKQKEKTERLSPTDEKVLRILDDFTRKMNSSVEILKQTQQHGIRKVRFSALQRYVKSVNDGITLIEELDK